jgi:large subunit ribosomal protein L17
MRHHDSKKKFGRKKNQRKALMSGLARSLVLQEKIKTTESKAKSVKPFAEKLVSRGKKDNLATRRFITSKIGGAGSKKVVEILAPKYKERKGGYLRIIKIGQRQSDGSEMAIIEFV